MKKQLLTFFKKPSTQTPNQLSVDGIRTRMDEEYLRILYDLMILASFNKADYKLADVKMMNQVLKKLSIAHLNKSWLINRVQLHQEVKMSLENIFNGLEKGLSLKQQETIIQATLIITRTDSQISAKNLELLINLGKLFNWEAADLKQFIQETLD